MELHELNDMEQACIFYSRFTAQNRLLQRNRNSKSNLKRHRSCFWQHARTQRKQIFWNHAPASPAFGTCPWYLWSTNSKITDYRFIGMANTRCQPDTARHSCSINRSIAVPPGGEPSFFVRAPNRYHGDIPKAGKNRYLMECNFTRIRCLLCQHSALQVGLNCVKV